uniref:ATP synthase complex subunit 8 n=1 Tax=Parastacus brasiliensis TaxID=108041 RepID=A0A411ATN7_9EUCA|nr:ATP synthase F0 subunit 8 [Parastacus brasiliensis]
MPQMGPLLWLNLFFMFLLGLLFFFVINYFNTPPMKMMTSYSFLSMIEKDWKW